MQSIQFKRTGVAGKIPTPESLQVGEIALNLKDHVIFTKDKEHKVVQISVSPETHTALESKVDANKKELDQTIALNDEAIHAKVDEIKTATDATISENHTEINNKVDVIKRETDAIIEANKNTAASDLATAKDELTATIEANKTAAALATEELDTRINTKVDGIKERTDATIQANDTAINEKVDTIKRDTDRTIAANAEHAQNQLEATYNHLTGVIEANKQEAAEAVTALSGTVEAKDTAIHKKVDGNKAHADGEIARLESRIDNIDGSSDGKFIKKDTNTKTDAWLVSRTANYEEPEVHGMEYLDYFGSYRVNGADNWGDYTGMILNVPHSWGKAHGRGFSFQYGSAGSHVRTYGFDANGEKAFSHRMYHEGDKPTPAELNVYSKQEVDRLFRKTINLDATGGWKKIATLVMDQNWGRGCYIKLVGGNGYNAGSVVQTNILEIVIRNSNANPVGLTATMYHHFYGLDQHCCVVATGGHSYDIYVSYSEHSMFVMAEYQVSGFDTSLTVYDNPENFTDKPTGNITDAFDIYSFNSQQNRGTLKFNVNQQNVYDIEDMSEVATEGLNHLRRFRSSLRSMIWHETIHNNYYRLSTGGGPESQEMLIVAQGNGKGGLVTAGRFTATGGNDGFKIHYDPATESAMFQIHSMPEGSLNAYLGYGSNNQSALTLYNRLGSINLTTKDGRGLVDIQGGLSVSGNQIVMYATDPNLNSSSPLYIQNWGNAAIDRPIVFELKDNTGYHFFSQRIGNGNIQFETAGQMIVRNNLDVYGGHGINIRSDTNRHVWFQDNAGTEKVVIYAENDGAFKIRTTAQQYSTRFGDGMLHTTGAPTVGSDRGLIRGHVGGGAWDAWRDRSAGILVDCPDSYNQAYSIWKATHWGVAHLASMGVHNGGGAPSVGMHIGSVAYWWDSVGDFNAARNLNCNDVYIRSDSRLKINVEEYEGNASDLINRLTVKTYDKVRSLKDREVVGHEIGIIAQDLKEILPEAVKLTNIGSPEEPEEVYTISNSAVSALLIKAVQEMSKEIEELKTPFWKKIIRKFRK
ncbi:tail fiber domain-containing protein [Salmonella enterica]|nr:tail fiber domain-containing protein [Salmonella enterica]